MVRSKKIVAVILGVAMLLLGGSVKTQAGENEDHLLNLLKSGQSRLVLEDYKALAIAKEGVDILNSSGEIIGRLEKDDAADITDFDNVKMQYHITSGEVAGYVPTGSLLREKDAEFKAIEILKRGNEEIRYDYTTYVSNKENGDKSFIVTVYGELNKASAIDKNENISTDYSISENAAPKTAVNESAKQEKTYSSKRNIKYTQKDLHLLAAIVQCEVGGCSRELKNAVANVVLNRVEDSRFPNTIEKVIYARRQFTPARNGKLLRVLKKGADKSCINAAKWALEGNNNVAGYLYFDGKPHKVGYLKIGPGYFWKTPF